MLSNTTLTKTTFFDANNNLMRIYVSQSDTANEYKFQIVNDSDEQIEDVITATYTRPNHISMVKKNGDIFNAGKMYDFLKKWINDSLKARRKDILQSPFIVDVQGQQLNGEYGIFPNKDGMIGVFEILNNSRKVDVVRVSFYSNHDTFEHYQQPNTYLLFPELESYFEKIILNARDEIIKLDRLTIA